MKNWIAGADRRDVSDGRIYCTSIFSVFFLKFQCSVSDRSVRWVGWLFQTEGAAWRKAWLAKTVLFLEDDRSVLGVVWKSSISARYSGFSVVIALKVRRAILTVICVTTGSQCSLAKTGVMWSLLLVPKTTCMSALRTAAASRDFRRMFHGERSYSSWDGSRSSNLPPCKPSPRRYMHVRIWREALMMEMSRLTYIVHVTVEGELVVESDVKALHW